MYRVNKEVVVNWKVGLRRREEESVDWKTDLGWVPYISPVLERPILTKSIEAQQALPVLDVEYGTQCFLN